MSVTDELLRAAEPHAPTFDPAGPRTGCGVARSTDDDGSGARPYDDDVGGPVHDIGPAHHIGEGTRREVR